MITAKNELARVARFYLLAVAISWLAWSPLVLGRNGLALLDINIPMPWTISGTLGPMLAALAMWHGEDGGIAKALRGLLRGSWRGVLGAVAGTVVVAATFVLGTALILTRDPPRGWDVGAFSLFGFHWLTTLLGGPIFEEWGWRGYAQQRLQPLLGTLRAGLVVGLGWGVWHFPLFLVPAWSSASPLEYVVMVIALSVVMAWGFRISGGWIVAAIAMHFIYNASSRVLGEFLGDATLRTFPDPVGGILLAFVSAALIVSLRTQKRRKLARQSD